MKSLKVVLSTLLMLICLISISYFEKELSFLKAEKFSFKLGPMVFSLYTALRTLLEIVLIFLGSLYLSRFIDSKIKNLDTKLSTKDLLVKSAHIILYFATFLITLKIIGIDITTLTVFGGAIFVGIGLGLQKIASNFIAGMFLLFEKSFEIGDILELSEGITGIVKTTNARYTLIESFSGKEIIVPNEELFVNRVMNWTHTHNKVRTEIIIKVPFKYDINHTQQIIENVILKSVSCLQIPKPCCLLKDVEQGIIFFVALCWIDVTRGFTASECKIRAEIWNELKSNNIESCHAIPELIINTIASK